MSVLELESAAQFDHIKSESEWTLVDFWAPWCAPCQLMLPVFGRVAESFASEVTSAKANVDDHSALASRFGIRGVPTLVLLHKGQVVDQLSGAQPQTAVASWIQKHLDQRK
ncbi:thioredoxin [Parendozoicomonas sp. Alg238-R29]|uniref:thioredoxin n=1 Tax=Parendozoicomonas sp. Alg238-R29 TaxID=2993446 RepID=UPI00248E79EB|nr:thioredoxin [Parendozoicomonas sp. Alg238-R29]